LTMYGLLARLQTLSFVIVPDTIVWASEIVNNKPTSKKMDTILIMFLLCGLMSA
jgi:hypothetical protein